MAKHKTHLNKTVYDFFALIGFVFEYIILGLLNERR